MRATHCTESDRWRYIPGVVNHTEESDTKCGAILDAQGWYVAAIERDCPEPTAHAERIVACVNGCAGIADPSAVGDMHEAIASAMEILTDSWGEEQLAAGDDQAYNVLARALAKAEGRG